MFLQKSIKICLDAKFQLVALNMIRISVSSTLVDPKVATWLLDPDRKEQNLAQMMADNLPTATFNLSGTKTECCCREAMQISLLMSHLQKRLKSNGLLDHFYTVEMPVCSVLVGLEIVGVGFDQQAFLKCWDFFSGYLEKVEAEAYALAGRRFSLCSPQQVFCNVIISPRHSI